MVADSLSRNVPVGVVTYHYPVTENFSLDELRVAKRDRYVWSRVIYALESGDETDLPALPVPFRQFFLSDERILCRYWPSKKQVASQFVIPQYYICTLVKLVHDEIISSTPWQRTHSHRGPYKLLLAYHAHRY